MHRTCSLYRNAPFILVNIFLALTKANSLSLQTKPRTFTAKTPSSTETPCLNKKSTALDVLRELNNSDILAPYITNGKGVVVVTGGSSGIGTCSVETLALAGMKVVLCARDIDAAETAMEKMPAAKNNVRIQKLDLADLYSVESAAKEILDKEGQIDVLLNNAGIMATPERMETAQNFELQFGTNHVGHHMFTRLLLPQIRQGGRVVTVASEAHRTGQMDFDDLNFSKGRKYSPWGSYGQSKLANVLFAKGLNDRLKENGSDIISLSLHPGVIKTPLWRNTPSVVQFLSGIINDKTVEQGAATNVYSCMMEPSAFEGGEYLMDCKVGTPSKDGEDASKKGRNELWDLTERMIADAGFALPEKLCQRQ